MGAASGQLFCFNCGRQGGSLSCRECQDCLHKNMKAILVWTAVNQESKHFCRQEIYKGKDVLNVSNIQDKSTTTVAAMAVDGVMGEAIIGSHIVDDHS